MQPYRSVSARLPKKWRPTSTTPFLPHGHTYEAHPLTLAPAIASINEMKRLKLPERATEMGAYLDRN